MKTMNKEKRTDLPKVDPKALKLIEGFNIRSEYGDIESLAKSIAERGVMVPLRGYRDPEDKQKIIVVDGHRRFKAIQYAINVLKAEIEYVPIVLEQRGYSKEDRILDMFTLNDGKRLEPIEEGELFKRLKSLGWEEKFIAQKTGRSLVHVYKMIEVANSPMTIKNAVKEGAISANTVSQIIKETKNEEEQKEMVQEAVKTAQNQGKKKATTKHVKKVSSKNPIAATEEALKLAEEKGVDNEKMDIIQAFICLLKKKPSSQDILNFIER